MNDISSIGNASIRGEGQSWVNWMWLAENTQRQDILVMGGVATVGILAAQFSVVRECAYPPGGARAEIPFSDASFDYVTMRGALAGIGTPKWDCALWLEANRVLRPGGILYLDGPQPSWPRSASRTGSRLTRFLGIGRVVRAVRRSGFDEVRAFYADPDLSAPKAFIPADRHVTTEWERFSQSPGVRRLGRVLISAVGRHDVLYSELLLLARK